MPVRSSASRTCGWSSSGIGTATPGWAGSWRVATRRSSSPASSPASGPSKVPVPSSSLGIHRTYKLSRMATPAQTTASPAPRGLVRAAHVSAPPTSPTGRAAWRPSASSALSVSVVLPCREVAQTIGPIAERGRCCLQRGGGSSTRRSWSTPAPRTAPPQLALRARARGPPGGRAAARVRPGARQGRRAVALALGRTRRPGRVRRLRHGQLRAPLRRRPARPAAGRPGGPSS